MSSIYKQLLDFTSQGAALLDNASMAEVKQFVGSLQNTDGGFADRDGRSDLYYSLFAHLILRSIHFNNYQNALKIFISGKREKKDNSLVDLCCRSILCKDLFRNRFSGLKYLISATKHIKNNLYETSLDYRYFLLFLTLDVYGFNNSLARWFIRWFYKKSSATEGLPCTLLAARVVFEKQLGYNVQSDCNLLISYFDGESGFRVSPEAKAADLLSTSVALFALKTSGSDIALIASACLRFVDGNFRGGAFLSGDGDEHRDLEYTFYGLLALGALS